MELKNRFLTYSLLTVATLGLAACGRDNTADRADRAEGTDQSYTGTTEADRTGTSGTTTGTTANVPLTDVDRQFAKQAAMGSMAEIEMAKLAQDRASSDRVKDFARQLEQDHQNASEELKRIAANTNIDLPTELDPKHRQVLDRLSKLSGARFDREFKRAQVRDHQEDVREFRKYAEQGSHPELKTFASNTLQKLEHHLSMTRDLQTGSSADRSMSERSTSGSRR